MSEASNHAGSLNVFSKRRRTEAIAPPHEQDTSRPTTAIRSDGSPLKGNHRRESSSLSDLGSTLRRRSTSLRSRGAKSPTFWDNVQFTSETLKRSTSAMRPQLAVSTPSTTSLVSLGKTATQTPVSATDAKLQKQAYLGHALKREDSNLRPSTALGVVNNVGRSFSSNGNGPVPHDSGLTTRRIHDAATKRISLFKYLHMIYSSETHWFNTYRFTPAHIRSLPSMHPVKLARRTQSLLLLGISIPFVLDPNQDSLLDYLRAFSALLSEYDSYITLHPSDGGSSSALSRARIPQLFKRGQTKGRRGSSNEGLLSSPQSAYDDPRSAGAGIGGGPPPSATWTTFPAGIQEHELNQGEEYQYLLTPSLPFDADYYQTFSTLCDVLSDCYRHILTLLERHDSKGATGEGNGILQSATDLFGKVDAKVKKIVLAGLVKEFEDASRQGIRSELAGVGKLVLGGLV